MDTTHDLLYSSVHSLNNFLGPSLLGERTSVVEALTELPSCRDLHNGSLASLPTHGSS